MNFQLKDHDHIPLNNLLKVLNLVETGGEANIRITDGEVKVNGQIETQKRKKLRPRDVVEFQKQKITIQLHPASTAGRQSPILKPKSHQSPR
ncbi:MAG: RNA-binding S4 domain-containing protein [Lewinellaceae bacterium]|nr:RNA-binding S4 domain-containing protein [Lewinellaceae bacterium]